MNGTERVDGIEHRVEEIETWKRAIEDERLTSRAQRTNLLWRVGLLEKVVWATIGAALGSIAWKHLGSP